MTPVATPAILVKQAEEKLRLAAAIAGFEARGLKIIADALAAIAAADESDADHDIRMSTAASLLNSAAGWCGPDDLTLADMLQEWTIRDLPEGWVIITPRTTGQ